MRNEEANGSDHLKGPHEDQVLGYETLIHEEWLYFLMCGFEGILSN